MEVEAAPVATMSEQPDAPPAPVAEIEKQEQENALQPEDEQPAVKEAPVEEQEAPKSSAKKPTPKKTPPVKKTPAKAPAEDGGRVKRERKQVEFFQVEAKKEEEFVIPVGTGTKLRDIPNVAFKLGKITGRDELLENFHNVLYRRKGTVTGRKKAILDFAGFAFDPETKDKEIEARKASLTKLTLPLLHKLMDTLDMPRGSGDKSAKVEEVMKFLLEPKAVSDVDLAAKDAARKAKEKAKRERQKNQKEKEVKRKATTTQEKKKPAAKKPKKEVEYESMGEESEPEEPSDDDHSDFEAEVAGKQKKPAAKKASPKKAAEPMEEDDDDEQEDPALAISSDELQKTVIAILEAMPAEELAELKTPDILAKVGEHYKMDFSARKKELKKIVRAWGEAQSAAAEEPAAPVEEAKPAPVVEEPKQSPQPPVAAPAAPEPEPFDANMFIN